MNQSPLKRIRDFGLKPGVLSPGHRNLISDVAGVTVGHVQITGANQSVSGLTVIDPSPQNIFRHKLPAAVAIGNAYGKSAGLTQMAEMGVLESPIALTSTHGVGAALQGVVELVANNTPDIAPYDSVNAVVGETNDWILNDLFKPQVTASDVTTAWDNRRADFALGSIGAGTGTRAFNFKGGIGSASRVTNINKTSYTVGVLVQTNFGGDLTIMGVPVGQKLGVEPSYTFGGPQPDGSCMIVLATDAPLSSRQLGRLAKRALFGLARTGSVMANSSGDYVLAFSTTISPDRMDDNDLNSLFLGSVEATEESIYDALFTSKTTRGRDGNVLEQLPIDRVVSILRESLA